MKICRLLVPDPDSPTSARVSPGRMEKDSSTTAVVVPESEVNCTRRCSTSNMGSSACGVMFVSLASIIVLVNWLAQAERMRCGRVDPLRAFDIRTARRGRDVLRRSLFMGLKQSTCHELLPRHAENPCIRSAQYCRTQCALLSSYHSASFCRRLFQYAQRSADSLDY